MRAGHIMYMVSDLKKSVEEWRNKGFTVEYGSKGKHNALIFFSEGPYIELADVNSMNGLFCFILNVMGGQPFVKRVKQKEILDKDKGVFCIEKDPGDLEKEIAFLKQKGEGGFYFKHGKRKDLQGRLLTWKLFFPNNLGLPFLMTYFDNGENPKPENYVHPNGVRRIKKLTYATNEKSIAVLKELLDDECIALTTSTKETGEVVTIEYL